MSQTTLNNFQFAPLRSLDDFVYESARFQLPNFGDFEKWGNRVVNNLLYYQTNYFVLVAIELIIMGLFQPTKVVLGIFAVASIAYGIYTIFGPNRNPAFDQLRSMNKYAVYALLFGVAFIILYLFDAVLFVTFSILFPISSIFIHSSLRLRSVKNRLSNAAEKLGVKHSPMGQVLEATGLMPETFQ